MQITKDTAVTLRYTLTDAQGKPRASDTTSYLHGGYGNLFEKVEAALEGKEAGFSTTVELAVEDAFGARDEALVRTISKSDFPPGVKVGGMLELPNEQGQTTGYMVMKIKGPVVHLDGNHPLAGLALKFACKVTGVRLASAEEIAHGHVHGDHGHRH